MSIIDQYLDGTFEGATKDRAYQKQLAAESRAPVYALAAPNVMDREPKKDVFLGRYLVMANRALGVENYFPRFQWSGTCVGQSKALLASIGVAVNALLSGLRFPGMVSMAPIYGGSRVEIGRQPGRWDGSVGSWAAGWITKFGVVTMREMGIDDSMKDEKSWLRAIQAEERLAVAWAASRSGVPANYEAMAKLRPFASSPLVTTPEEVRASLSNLTPVNVCGSVHPSKELDSRGVSKSIKRGGGHSTGIIGCHFDGKDWWYDHVNSWGAFYRGGFARAGHPMDKLFRGSVTRIPESWLLHWLRERDCYALVGVQGLEPIDPMFEDLLR